MKVIEMLAANGTNLDYYLPFNGDKRRRQTALQSAFLNTLDPHIFDLLVEKGADMYKVCTYEESEDGEPLEQDLIYKWIRNTKEDVTDILDTGDERHGHIEYFIDDQRTRLEMLKKNNYKALDNVITAINDVMKPLEITL